ncbi:hypothetical protein D7Z26_21520 [Cohnella endophytica]|uniref:DUF4432 family protein n=1 Tax=Cohnella endophytica TaxID=2419778 RepID=A0A494XEI7_9BACL|nr:hypothetical protein [Cohnella endophytica]RKP48938.1 hypothetical protein D7Z26_21520 [Cohnella endophytica]
MKRGIEESTFKGFRALRMESELMELIVVPELGAKIVSLRYKPTGKEWLVDSGSRFLAPVEYGSEFGQADLSGWDECFPTIVACGYPAEGVYKGALLPDHGELWSIPWEASAYGGELTCKVNGRALPYEFTRSISFLDDNSVRIEYSAANLSSEPLSVFWCAHPLFVATEQSRIILPAEVTQLLCVDGGQRLTKGRLYEWPHGDGSLPRGIDLIGPLAAKDSRKYYVNGRVEEGRTGLIERDSGEYVTLEWDPVQLPYLGVWIDEGRLIGHQTVCALEPCNGFYDRLDEAYGRGRTVRIEANQTERWALHVRLGAQPVE